jgi:hypothetical protein
VTGITKFVKGGLYSAFNNPVDISYEPEYGAIVGFTHDEILSNLGEELEEAAKRQKISLASLITKMKNYYDGFCFDGVTEVYNPISALYFLSSKQFENFWYDTASPQQVMTFLAEHNITLEALNGVEVTKREIKHPNFDRQLQGSVYLFQLGYLTLQPGSTSDTFKLILPNAEIKQSIAISLLETWFSSKYQNVNQTFVNEILKRFAEALADKNPAGVIREFNIALSCVPFTIYSHAKRDEYFYSGLLSVLFYGIELDAHVQQPAKLGIPDFIITHNKQTWVIELKVCREGENDETKAKEALKQIIETEYAGSYHNPVLLGAAVNDKTRRIKRWLALGAKPEFSEQERETENSKEICSGANEALTNEDEEPGDHKS